MTFRTLLQQAFAQRRAVNRNYSLRAFAKLLRTDHATLSQMLRGQRRLTTRSVRALGKRLGLSRAQIDEYCRQEHEAAILALLPDARFRTDSRWLAMVLNIPLDHVNIALQRLLRSRVLTMKSSRRWELA